MMRTRLIVTRLAVVLSFLVVAVSSSTAGMTKVLHNFSWAPDGSYPIASLTVDKDGNLYGTTYLGGEYECGYEYGCGTIFRLSPDGNGQWKETVLHSFTGGEDGCSPNANLIFDAAGNLYGTASGAGDVDGPCGNGTVFELSPGPNDTWTFKVLYSFARQDGASPGGMIFDAAGNLFGVTGAGGASDGGTVFELSPGNNGMWTEKVLLSFTYQGELGFNPVGNPVLDKTGNLYGVTCCGGPNTDMCRPDNYGCGVVFELTRASDDKWTERILHNFNYTDGTRPSGLVSDAAGNLYGTTLGGGILGYGIVFELSPKTNRGWTKKVLHYFSGSNGDGSDPSGALVFDASGNLYGTTTFGGAFGSQCGNTYNCGTVFELKPDSTTAHWTERVLHRFNGADGAFPQAGLILDSDGNLYGDASAEGSFGDHCGFYYRSGTCGTVFKITPP